MGAGIIAGGRRLTGHGGYGGEVGHMKVVRDGRPCECGSRGCWETEIGEHGLLRAAGRSDARGVTRCWRCSTPPTGRRTGPDGRPSGRRLARLRGGQPGERLQPEMVIFGGTMRDLYLAAAAQIRSRLNSNALAACLEHVRLRTPMLGEDAP
ncbi:ROK family protein [Micromonospora sp. M12]